MLQPDLRERTVGRKPLHPHLAPFVTNDLRVGRHGIFDQHEVRPEFLLVDQGPTHVVNVIGVAIIGGAKRDDGFEGWRATCRHLQCIEAAPGNASHADVAIAPGFGCQLRNDLTGVQLFLRQIFIMQNSLAFAQSKDKNDVLKKYRRQFHFPQHEGKDVLYFCGNSLGLQPKSIKKALLNELEQWSKYGVEGHFMGDLPWMHYHKFLTEQSKEDLLLAKLIDEAMEEDGEIEKEKVLQFVKKHAV